MKKRTMYNLNHQTSTLSNIGRLCPFMYQEVAPGDTWSGKVNALIRLSPLKHALVQDLYVDMFMFYVPHRLTYANWEDFIANGPQASPAISMPTVTVPAGSADYKSLFWDSHGTDTTNYNALRLYAYNLIYNEFFRDDEQAVLSPTSAPGQFGVRVAYKKDYWSVLQDEIGTADTEHFFSTNVGSGTQASAIDVLEAIARQKIALKRETYGTRYIDILRSYGINVNYQMLQRPETVAIGRGTISVTDVVASDAANLGDLAGHGIASVSMKVRRKSFPEHGTLMGMVVVRPPWVNHSANEWMDRARTYEHYYDPGLVPLPPVEVTKQDVVPSILTANRTDNIGYWPWGEWYRKALSRTHDTLANWTYEADLDQTDITEADLRNVANLDYNFSDVTYEHWQGFFRNNLRALRLLPRNNISTVTGLGG